MQIKTLVLFAVAIGCGLVAMFGVQQALSRPPEDPDANYTAIYVAAQEISPGIFIDEKQVKKVKWPKDNLPEGAIRDPKEFAERVLIAKAVPGEPLVKGKLGEKGKSGAAVSIPKDYRVYTVPVNMTQAHSGMIQPKDRVDVIVCYTIDIPGQGQMRKSKTILEYVEVFATDKVREVSGSAPEDAKGTTKNISLVLTPEQINLLTLAESKGDLHLALRHPEDKKQIRVKAIDETAFDGAAISSNVSTASEGREAPEDPETAKDFLDQLDRDKEAVAAKPVESGPTTESWTITIFEKDQKREEVIQLPIEAATTPPAEPATRAAGWESWLPTFGPKTNSKPIAPKPVAAGKPVAQAGTN